MVPYYCWRQIPSAFWRRIPTHADLFYYPTHLAGANMIFCHGTLYASPSLFHHFYTVHAMVDGSMYPLVFALLPGKDEVIYTRFFSHIRQIAQQHQLQHQQDTVFIDYETATNNAARTVFHVAIVKGCFFHFTQCFWRKTKKCVLPTYYKENNDITRLVQRAAVLPLVPQHLVEDVWLNALEDIGEVDNVPDTTSFTDHVTEFWFEGHRILWNHYHTEGPRPTNHLEGWHNKKKVHHAHPNIYQIIEVLNNTIRWHYPYLAHQRSGIEPHTTTSSNYIENLFFKFYLKG